MYFMSIYTFSRITSFVNCIHLADNKILIMFKICKELFLLYIYKYILNNFSEKKIHKIKISIIS